MTSCNVYKNVHVLLKYIRTRAPEGSLVVSDVSLPSGISGLSFDSTLLSPFLVFLPSPILSSSFFFFFSFCLVQHFPEHFSKYSSIFFVKSWSVVWAACCHMTLVFAVIHLNTFSFFFNICIAFVHSFFSFSFFFFFSNLVE